MSDEEKTIKVRLRGEVNGGDAVIKPGTILDVPEKQAKAMIDVGTAERVGNGTAVDQVSERASAAEGEVANMRALLTAQEDVTKEALALAKADEGQRDAAAKRLAAAEKKLAALTAE